MKVKLLLCLLGASCMAFAQDDFSGSASRLNFKPSKSDPEERTPIAKKNHFGLGFFMDSSLLLNKPFSSLAGGTSKNFRYQAPISFGLELDFALTPSFEVGVGASFRTFESRVDLTASTTTTEFQTVKYRSYPVMGIVRYRLGGSRHLSPEIEGGVGYSFGSVRVTSTNVTASSSNKTQNALEAYGAAGVAVSWTDDFSLHLTAGYAYSGLSARTYESTVTQKSFSGVYSKGLIRYLF